VARLPFAFSRFSGLGPLPRLFEAEAGGTSLGRLLASENFHLDSMAPSTPIPFAGLNQIFNRATRQSGDPLFPVRVAQATRPEDYGPMVVYALGAPTLGASINRIWQLVPLQSSAMSLELEVRGPEARWSLNYTAARGLNVDHHALHVLVPLVDIVRRFAGVRPGRVGLDLASPRNREYRLIEDALELPIRPGANRFSVTFPAGWLRMPHPAGRAAAFASYSDMIAYYRQDDLPRSVTDTVAALLWPIVGNDQVDLDGIASRLNVSRRTLQQQLNAEGSSFRDIMLDVRMRRAKQLMRSSRESIAQVALAVGYSDQAHFTRAFRGVTGITPEGFRRHGRSGALIAAE
jgi:AraC-like DNA-binding protein